MPGATYISKNEKCSTWNRLDLRWKKFTFFTVTVTLPITRGLGMPFIPMIPKNGVPLRTAAQIKSAVQDLENDSLVVQPKLGGQRACLALVDRKIYIQDQQGNWITKPPDNGHDFLKLPNRTCLDGEIAFGDFYPSECLAIRDEALVFKPASERETVAFQLVKFLGHRWMFARPSAKFVRAAKENLPRFKGLVFKDYMSFYALLSSPNQFSKDWLKRQW
jgi:hypothetical protein